MVEYGRFAASEKDWDRTQAQVYQVLLTYLDVYFHRRNHPGTVAMFSPTITGFGTGVDEVGGDGQGLQTLYLRDIREAPNPIQYEISHLKIQTPLAGLGIVACELNIRTTVLGQELKLNCIRLSLVLVQTESTWLIEHMHISQPTLAHAGDESYPIKELEDQAARLQRLVEEQTGELTEALRQISLLAITDKLTGLFNRAKMDDVLDGEINRSQRYNNQFSAILIDIDHFKRINDTYGHWIGDQVLSEFAELTRQRLRRIDQLCRWGGDEFVLICPETGLGSAMQLAEEIRAKTQTHTFHTVGQLTVSQGVSSYRHDDTCETLISRLDNALYEAKQNGRNQVVAH